MFSLMMSDWFNSIRVGQTEAAVKLEDILQMCQREKRFNLETSKTMQDYIWRGQCMSSVAEVIHVFYISA